MTALSALFVQAWGLVRIVTAKRIEACSFVMGDSVWLNIGIKY
jgi:hypothetical protein